MADSKMKAARKRAAEARDRKLRGKREPMSKAGYKYAEKMAKTPSERAEVRRRRLQGR